MIEYATTDPHPTDLGGCAHCERRGPVTDCPACGDDRCAACAAGECREPVACSCGRTVEGRAIHWTDDGEPYCDDCDPTAECDHCHAIVRLHEIDVIDVPDYGTPLRYGYAYDRYELCRECRGEEG